MNNKSSNIKLIKILLGAYIGIAVLLLITSSLVLDLSLNAMIIVVLRFYVSTL